MIRISDKSLCSGCTACVCACPAQCIVMRRDREGFDYPVANPDLCLKCGLCERICPVLNPQEKVEPFAAYAARNEYRLDGSSSGGVFPLIAEKFVEDGGEVCGAEYEKYCKVVHSLAERIEDVERFYGSKYSQSELYSIYDDIRSELEDGRKVLFSGTPCQVAGLKAYLRKDYAGLYTVDVACHGVPSPGLWDKYREALEDKYQSRLMRVDFRDKSQSWRHYNIRYVFVHAGTKVVPRMKDPYLALFLQDMTLRPSCYECRFRNGSSGSDLTLADLWSVEQSCPQMNDDRGASGVLINTDKGRELFEGVVEDLAVCEISVDDVRKENGGFSGPVEVPEKRAEFFKGVHSASDLPRYMARYVVRKPLIYRVYRSVRGFLSQIKRRFIK